MANGSMKMWMGLALGSVLVVGVSAGLVADRLLAERSAVDKEPKTSSRTHDDRRSMFHFDCRGWEEEQAEATASPPGEGQADAVDPVSYDEYRSKVTHRMARRLELDAEQIEALEPIVGEAMERGRLYWTGARDEFCAMQRDFHRQVGALLRPDQAVLFDEMSEELWKRGRRHDGRGRDGSGRDRHQEDGSPEACR